MTQKNSAASQTDDIAKHLRQQVADEISRQASEGGPAADTTEIPPSLAEAVQREAEARSAHEKAEARRKKDEATDAKLDATLASDDCPAAPS